MNTKFEVNDVVDYNLIRPTRSKIHFIKISKDGVFYEMTNGDIVSEYKLTLVVGLPKTYEEALKLVETAYYKSGGGYIKVNPKNDVPTYYACSISGETALKHVAFEKLIFLRDIYRQGWTPDFSKDDTYVFSIYYDGIHVTTADASAYHSVLSFETIEIRDLFLKNFKNLIEECKEFI